MSCRSCPRRPVVEEPLGPLIPDARVGGGRRTIPREAGGGMRRLSAPRAHSGYLSPFPDVVCISLSANLFFAPTGTPSLAAAILRRPQPRHVSHRQIRFQQAIRPCLRQLPRGVDPEGHQGAQGKIPRYAARAHAHP